MLLDYARKPEQKISEDPSLELVLKAIANSERYLDEDREKSRRYFNHAQRLFDHWYMQTRKHDYQVGSRLDQLSEIFDPPNYPRPWF
ncbi:MAG: hypothetical protein Q7S55_04990 [Nanoarchaeota archaeon]|nr:hypothetical protein [Nanoarchaeota archaeon]